MSIKVNGEWQGNMSYKTVAQRSGHEITMDASVEAGGDNAGPSPMEVMLSSLIGCMGIDMSLILKPHRDKISKMDINAEGFRVEEKPQRYDKIELIVDVEGDVLAKHVFRAIDLSMDKYCSARASMNAEVEAKLILNGEVVER